MPSICFLTVAHSFTFVQSRLQIDYRSFRLLAAHQATGWGFFAGAPSRVTRLARQGSWVQGSRVQGFFVFFWGVEGGLVFLGERGREGREGRGYVLFFLGGKRRGGRVRSLFLSFFWSGIFEVFLRFVFMSFEFFGFLKVF